MSIKIEVGFVQSDYSWLADSRYTVEDNYIKKITFGSKNLDDYNVFLTRPQRVNVTIFSHNSTSARMLRALLLSVNTVNDKNLLRNEFKIFKNNEGIFVGVCDLTSVQYNNLTKEISFTLYDRLKLINLYSDDTTKRFNDGGINKESFLRGTPADLMLRYIAALELDSQRFIDFTATATTPSLQVGGIDPGDSTEIIGSELIYKGQNEKEWLTLNNWTNYIPRTDPPFWPFVYHDHKRYYMIRDAGELGIQICWFTTQLFTQSTTGWSEYIIAQRIECTQIRIHNLVVSEERFSYINPEFQTLGTDDTEELALRVIRFRNRGWDEFLAWCAEWSVPLYGNDVDVTPDPNIWRSNVISGDYSSGGSHIAIAGQRIPSGHGSSRYYIFWDETPTDDVFVPRVFFWGEVFEPVLTMGKYFVSKISEALPTLPSMFSNLQPDTPKLLDMIKCILLYYNNFLFCDGDGRVIMQDRELSMTPIEIPLSSIIAQYEISGLTNYIFPDKNLLPISGDDTGYLQDKTELYYYDYMSDKKIIDIELFNGNDDDDVFATPLSLGDQCTVEYLSSATITIIDIQKDYLKNTYKIKGWY
ncbi:MAG: hypothetical protein DRQ46_00495 [Gammaproteobacteria bacterium]|nr:MAG: hypothetical protein DRQ46_00495 [Gammaproteobacteria bacterium]